MDFLCRHTYQLSSTQKEGQYISPEDNSAKWKAAMIVLSSAIMLKDSIKPNPAIAKQIANDLYNTRRKRRGNAYSTRISGKETAKQQKFTYDIMNYVGKIIIDEVDLNGKQMLI